MWLSVSITHQRVRSVKQDSTLLFYHILFKYMIGHSVTVRATNKIGTMLLHKQIFC